MLLYLPSHGAEVLVSKERFDLRLTAPYHHNHQKLFLHSLLSNPESNQDLQNQNLT